MLYRIEIDGLRAICILPVIFYHFNFPYFNGGYIGVDIFFVISGYLICSLVLKDINEKKFSLKNFYERRARRILPLLFFVIIITTVVSKTLYSPDYFLEIIDSSLSSTFLFSNFYFWKLSGYFEIGTELNPLFHTWSLSIEEQFYILFPLLFLFFFNFFQKRILFLIVIVILAGLSISVYTSRFHPSANFYLLPFRTFEICFGVLSALIYNFYNLKNINNNYKNYLSLFGFFIIILSIFLFTEDTLSPGLISILPITGCVIVILFCDMNTYIYKVLSNKLLVFIGLISYGLYLWHIPILNFYKIIFSISSKIDYLLIFTLVFFISILTWKYIEKPFRNFKKIESKNFFRFIFIFIAIYLALILSLNFSLEDNKKNFISKLDKNQKIIYKQTQLAKLDNGYNNMFDNHKCKFWYKKLNNDFKKRFNNCFIKLNKKAIFLFGDSHQMDFYNGITKLTSEDFFIVSISRGRCRLHNPRPLGYEGCDFDNIKNFINSNKDKIDTIIYHQAGSFFLYGNKSLPIKRNDILKALDYLNKIDSKKIVWLGPRIEPNILIDYTFTKNFKKYKNFVNYNINFVDKEIYNILKNSSINYVSLIDLYDFELDKDFFVEKKFTFSDFDHWSSFGETYFTRKILINSPFIAKIFQ
ncbi:acyltransferase family protein [Candidatus Pelagibacter sp. HIMB1517]|uniref:acyltransferase family protein n=1 Tax=Candidatus Pelagibacter sp. HIMB1517 TaxID=3413341 RepID=UPI003F87FDFB